MLSSNCSKLRTRPRLACTSLQKPNSVRLPNASMSIRSVTAISDQLIIRNIVQSSRVTRQQRRQGNGGGKESSERGALEARHLHEPAHVVRVEPVLDGPVRQAVPLGRVPPVEREARLRVLVLAILQFHLHLLHAANTI